MHPYLDLGPLRLSTYALLIALGWLLAVSVAVRLGRRRDLPSRRLVDFSFWVLVAAIVGSRVGYWIEQAPVWLEVCRDPALPADDPRALLCADFWKPWRGGFVFYGGLALALPVGVLLARRYRLPLWPTFDAFAPALALAHGLGRLGCFLGGCCYGAVCHLPWAVRFPAESLPGPAPRHPTQLYEAAAELAIFGLLLWLDRRRGAPAATARSATGPVPAATLPAGRLFAAWLVLYPAARFVVELFRGDPQRGYLVELPWDGLRQALGLPLGHAPLLSWAQAVSLVLLGCGVWLWRRAGRA